MRYSSIVAALMSTPVAALLAQNPGQNARVDVGVASVSTVGDTTGISYRVTNLATSTEPLWTYNVDAPTGVLHMTASTGSLRWRTGTNFGGQSMAGWMFLHDYVPPGAITPDLHFESIGLPGIRTYWAGGHFPLPPAENLEVTDSTVLPDPFVTQMINGQTIGVDPWPSDRSGQALLARLRTLTQNSCSTPPNWITDASLCNQLLTDLDQAESYRASGQSAQARDVLAGYQSRISTGNNSGTVKSPAFWLLKSNAEIVLTVL
jgi:hypothetical protein